MANARIAKDYMSSHVVRFFFFLRALDVSSLQPAIRRNNARHKRGVVASHSADTGTSPRQIFPYETRYRLWSSVQEHVSWKIFIFLKHLTFHFQNGNFVYVSIIKFLSSFDAGHIYIHKLASQRIE